MTVYRLSDTLKPVLVLLQMAGLYAQPIKSNRRTKKVGKIFINVLTISLLVFSLLVVCLDQLCHLLSDWRQGKHFLIALYGLTVQLSTLYASVAAFAVTPRRFRKLFVKLDEYYERYDKSRDLVKLRRLFTLSFILISLTIIPADFIQDIFLVDIYSGSNSSEPLPWPVVNEPWVKLMSKSYSELPLSFLTAQYGLVFYLMHSSAQHLVKDLKSLDAKVLQAFPPLLEDFRLRHEALCKLIAKSNAVIGHFVAIIYVGGIPCLLFMLHGFVYGSVKVNEFKQMALEFAHITALMVFVTMSGIVLNRKMHKPAEYLLSLNIEKMPGKGSEIVAAFLSRLQGKSIGFHVYHLFTIDTSTIMMVCGTILTYAVVIIQFQPGIGGGGGGSIVSAPLPNPTPSPGPPHSTTLLHSPVVAINGTN